MKTIAFLLSLFVAAMGALGVVSPPMLLSTVRRLTSPAGVYAVSALRMIMGSALYLSAPASRIPKAVRALGDITFASGIIAPFFGPERFRRLLEWWSVQGTPFIRVWAFVAVVSGLLLAWAVAPVRLRRITRAPASQPRTENLSAG